MVHNIISAIPLTAQTDPNKFPAYEYREYPKMMLRTATAEDIKTWEELNKQVDERSGKAYWPAGRPRLGAQIPYKSPDGMPIMVSDAEEEEAFRLDNPEALEIKSLDTAAMQDELAQLRAENAALRAKSEGATNEKEGGNKIANLTNKPSALAAVKASKTHKANKVKKKDDLPANF